MSKRRISQQQTARINKKQSNYQKNIANNADLTSFDGLIIKRFSRHAQVETQDGTQIRCTIRPHLDTLVAGDRVVWQAQPNDHGVIISRYPRHSVLERSDSRGQLKPVAANITQAMIVIAPKPEISWPLLDSYLVMAEYLQLNACIVLNKTDLASNDLKHQIQTYYEHLPYPLIFTGFDQDKGYQLLQDTLNHQISVFVGQSGVGKSSLIAKLLPEKVEQINVGDISLKSELGCHTTSNSCFYHLPTGGAIIDSPGVREFNVSHIPASEVIKGFREFRPYLTECKFRNCNHTDTPGCALQEALKNKLINQQRYQNYVKISNQFAK